MPSRIGRNDIGGATPLPATMPESVLQRALASPWAILIVFPAIVILTGVFLTLNGLNALKENATAMAKEHLHDQAHLTARRIDVALDASDPVLTQLDAAVRTATAASPPELLGPIMRDLMHGRAGMSYISASFPDGTFQGAYLDDDDVIRFQISRIAPEGKTKKVVYDYGPGRTLTPRDVSTTDYDPTKREFYRLATESDGRVWTKPYPFAGTNWTGITRTEALYLAPVAESGPPSLGAPNGVQPIAGTKPPLHAVLTVDYDVRGLSKMLIDLLGDERSKDKRLKDGRRVLLVDETGVLLGAPGAQEAIKKLRRPGDILNFQDLKDPVVNEVFEAEKAAPNDELLNFEVGEDMHLAAVEPVGKGSSLGWRLAYVAPEASFLESLHRLSARSWMIAGIAVAAAFLLSVGFARIITRARREAIDARALARKAQQQAQELGSYRLLSCLGKGGMGEVWRAEHRLLARQAAIKLIRSDRDEAPSPEAIERFRREAQTLATLRSTNTIELYDYGVTDDGTLFYVMELLDGLDFETLVNESGPLPPGRVIHLLTQACRSLAEAHAAGLVHRDIKPANLFTCRRAEEVDLVKVLDFGLVRAIAADNTTLAPAAPGAEDSLERLRSLASIEDVTGATLDGSQYLGDSRMAPAESAAISTKLTRADRVMGTPEYMAPEQATGLDVDARADLYALGAVAFWLLTGTPLFRRSNVFQMLVAHMTEAPPDVTHLCPAPLPDALVSLINDCLAKPPDQRPQSARELLQRLQAIELSPDERWTPARAAAWWDQHRPLGAVSTQTETVSIDMNDQISQARVLVSNG